MMATEIAGLAGVVMEVVEPTDVEVEPPEFGTARQMQRWARHMGYSVSRWRIQAAIDSGQIPSMARPDGARLVRLHDVLGLGK